MSLDKSPHSCSVQNVTRTWDGNGAVHVRVPGKINLVLAVGPRRDDGYHELVTVFQAVGLYDDIVAEPGEPGEFSLTMRGEGSEELAVDETNLAIRAARLLADEFRSPKLGVRLAIRKGIPIAGGMAGGSADAAGTLLACSVLWDLDTSPDDLRDLGAELGSDVPFGLMGGCAVGTGRGERLTPALVRGRYQWVFAFADEGLSTPAVFRQFDELGLGTGAPQLPNGIMAALASGDPRALAASLRNDLQPAALALRPELGELLDFGLAHGALGAVVSGSGPTCGFLTAGESQAIDLSGDLTANGLCRSARRVVGPAPGARLLS